MTIPEIRQRVQDVLNTTSERSHGETASLLYQLITLIPPSERTAAELLVVAASDDRDQT